MKIKQTDIPVNSVVNRYLPVDYSDVFACDVPSCPNLSPNDILISFWTDFPGWVKALFKLRNFLVQFVGLKGSDERELEKLAECIRTGGEYGFSSVPDKTENETVLLLADKHLDAYLSVYKEDISDDYTRISVITLVHFNKRLGNIYFFFIRPFHKIIVRQMLKRVLIKLC